MKKISFQFFSFIFLLLSINCIADCSKNEMHFIPCPKTYVTPEQIVFHENAIFVQVNGMVMQTQRISVDQQGIFFADARDGDCGAMQWKCVKPIVPGIPCDTCNWIWHSWCTNCGKWR